MFGPQKNSQRNISLLKSTIFCVALLTLTTLVSGQNEFQCLLEDLITDQCLENLDVDQVSKMQPELGGYICTVMTMKIRERKINQGTLPPFAIKAEGLCEKMSAVNLQNGYNLFQTYLMKESLLDAFSLEYELFFKSPFNHGAEIAEIFPKHKQILENKLKTLKNQAQSIEKQIKQLILNIYLQKSEEGYKILQSMYELPNDIVYAFLQIRILEKNQQYSEALQFLTKYLQKLNEDHKEPHWYLYHLKGNYQMHHLQFNAALQSFTQSMNAKSVSHPQEKQFSFSPYNMGLCYQKLQKFQQSIVLLKRALLADPEAAEIHNSIGFSYYEMMVGAKDLEEINKNEAAATKYFKDAISKNQGYSVAYYNYGMLLYDRGHFQSATKMFKKATQYKLNFQSANYAMFKALYMIDHKKALKFMDDNLATSKQYAKDLGVLLYQVGEYHKAYGFIVDAVQLNRNLDQVYEWKGIMQFHLDQYNKAFQSFQLAINHGNNKSTVYFNLGYLHRMRKQYKQALKYFNKSIQASDNEQARTQIKQTQKEMVRSEQL